MPGYFAAIGTFLLAAFIIYLSYICSKYLGRGLAKNGSSRYMRLVDQMVVGQNRTLVIVQAGSQYLLLGITQEQIQILAEIPEEDLIPLSAEGGENPLDFGQILAKLGKKRMTAWCDAGSEEVRLWITTHLWIIMRL